MTMTTRSLIRAALTATAAAATSFAPAAQANDYKLGTLQIVQPWTRATPGGAQAGGGFMKLVNGGGTADRLISARSAAADRVEIHEMRMEGSIMRMRELEKGLELPAGATVELKPGGYHIMFMGLKAPFAQDARVPITLVFEKAGTVDVEMVVQARGAAEPGHRH
jgi:copper(I)-binding protein